MQGKSYSKWILIVKTNLMKALDAESFGEVNGHGMSWVLGIETLVDFLYKFHHLDVELIVRWTLASVLTIHLLKSASHFTHDSFFGIENVISQFSFGWRLLKFLVVWEIWVKEVSHKKLLI